MDLMKFWTHSTHDASEPEDPGKEASRKKYSRYLQGAEDGLHISAHTLVRTLFVAASDSLPLQITGLISEFTLFKFWISTSRGPVLTLS